MIGSDKPNTVFGGEHLLAYAGACIFGLAVYLQTQRMNKINKGLQEQTVRLEDYNLQYNTFVFLNIVKLETSADYAPVTTHTLIKEVPYPLDVRASRVGYPGGIPKNIPRRLRKMLEKEMPNFPIGNSEDYREEVIEKRELFQYKTEHNESWLQIDPYVGVLRNGSTKPHLVMWQNDAPIPRYYKYLTPLNLTFYAKSSRENFFVSMVEIYDFTLTLRSQNGTYMFINKNTIPFSVKPLATDRYECDHIFGMELYLAHSIDKMLETTDYPEIDIELDAAYINAFGVRTNRRIGFRYGEFHKKVVESELLDEHGVPFKKTVYEAAGLQPYLASHLDIEINREMRE